jgi:anti-sigma B factor antagonist
MNVRVEKSVDATIVRLSGDLTLATSGPVRNELVKLVNSLEGKRMIIDMREVSALDSMGVATLVEALKMSRDKHIELVLAGVHGDVREVLTSSSLNKVFNIVEEPT